MMRSNVFRRDFALMVGFALLTCALTAAARAGNVMIPVRVSASSNGDPGEDESPFHVSTLLLGAKHFDPATGSNPPYGLMGYRHQILSCVTAESDGKGDFAAHEDFRAHPADHPKHRGMWMSKNGDNEDAWVEFELPEQTALGQILIWNWNDAPEVGRRVRHVTIQTSTQTASAGQLGNVDYDVTHKQIHLPDIGQVQGRTPDIVYQFPSGTRSRYVRLHDMDNFGSDSVLGLAEVFILEAGEPDSEAKPAANKVKPSVEPHWHLFLDDHSITRSTGFQRVIHHPQPRGLVLRGDNP